MRFEWDEEKRRSNLKRHGFDFIDIGRVFAGEVLTVLDGRYDYGETRFFSLGLLAGKVVAIAHTETDEISRIISFRKASKREEEIYYKKIRN